MFRLQTRIPPPVVTLGIGGFMWLSANAVPGLSVDYAAQEALAAAIAAGGVILMDVAIFEFRRAKTTVNPLNPAQASSLVTTGVFAFSRNPIYLADLLFLIAFATWLGNALAFAIAPALVWYLNAFQIAPEEQALTLLFGDEYRDYCSRVRRWI